MFVFYIHRLKPCRQTEKTGVIIAAAQEVELFSLVKSSGSLKQRWTSYLLLDEQVCVAVRSVYWVLWVRQSDVEHSRGTSSR